MDFITQAMDAVSSYMTPFISSTTTATHKPIAPSSTETFQQRFTRLEKLFYDAIINDNISYIEEFLQSSCSDYYERFKYSIPTTYPPKIQSPKPIMSPMMLVILLNKRTIMQVLMKFECEFFGDDEFQPIQVDANNNCLLHYAILSGNIDTFEYVLSLLKLTVPLNQFRVNLTSSPLRYAVSSNQFNIVEHLITKYQCHPLPIDKYNRSIIHYIAQSASIEIFNYIIQLPNVLSLIESQDKLGQTPLYYALISKQFELAQILIQKYNVDVQCIDKDDTTLLHLAARHNHIELIDILFERDPKFFILQSEQYPRGNALHSAAFCGHFEASKHLIEKYQLSIDRCNHQGETILHLAAMRGSITFIEYILSKLPVTIINQRDNFRATPIMLAAKYGNIAVFELLLYTYNADLYILDDKGLSVMDYGIESDKTEMILTISKALETIPFKPFQDTTTTSTTPNTELDVPKTTTLPTTDFNLLRTLPTHYELITGEWRTHKTTPFYTAVKAGYINSIKGLIQCKASLTVGYDRPTTLILHEIIDDATIINRVKIVEYLISDEFIIDWNMNPIKFPQCYNIHLKQLKSPIRDQIEQKQWGSTALFIAGEGKDFDLMQLLLLHNANVLTTDGHGRNILYYILCYLDGKSDWYDDALHLLNFILDYDTTTVLQLLNPIQSINDSSIPILDCVKISSISIIRELIHSKADINIISPHSGQTVLHYAITNQNYCIVGDLFDEYPIETRQQLVIQDKYGMVPFLGVIARFIVNKITLEEDFNIIINNDDQNDINGVSNDGSSNNNEEEGDDIKENLYFQNLHLFLDYDTKLCLNQKSQNGQTCIHIAAEYGHDDIYRMEYIICTIIDKLDDIEL